MLKTIFHLICYYTTWFICILTAAHHDYWLGFVTSIFITSIQFLFQHKINESRHLVFFILIITIAGLFADSLFATFNFVSFKANPFFVNISPPWMIGVWINFSLILYACLKKYFLMYKTFALLSLLGFPLAYAAGIKLGAASLPRGYIGLFIIGITWSIVLPTLLYLFETFSRKHHYA